MHIAEKVHYLNARAFFLGFDLASAGRTKILEMTYLGGNLHVRHGVS